MKVRGLIKLLQEYNQNGEVLVTWEGIFRDLKNSSIYLAANGKVVIDADENLYKKEIVQGIRHIP